MNVNASEFAFNPIQTTNIFDGILPPTMPLREGAAMQGSDTNDKYLTKFKTELCKSYCENGYCRYGKKCKYAHGTQELQFDTEVIKKDKNCKTFFAKGQCPYGVRC